MQETAFPLLVTDADGAVRHANPVAEAALGGALGRDCRLLVDARGPDGAAICAPCATAGPAAGELRLHGLVQVRGRSYELECAAVGGARVVALRPAEAAAPDPLTAREREVLVLVARGLTNARVGARLGLSAATVRTHMEHVLRKLGVRTRTQAVARALAIGAIA
jgi:DNA-binding CsgD family transcriptional regulator